MRFEQIFCHTPSRSVAANDERQMSWVALKSPRGQVRWLLPVGNVSAGISFLKSWRPYGSLSSFFWPWLLWVVKSDLGRLLLNLHTYQLADEKLQTVARSAARHKDFVIYVGTDPDIQKLICFVLPLRSEAGLVLKVPLSEEAAGRTRKEVRIRSKMRTLTPNILVPDVLYHDPKMGVLTESMLVGKASEAVFTEAHTRFLEMLVMPDRLDFIAEIEQLKRGLAGYGDDDFVHSVVARLEPSSFSFFAPAVIEHGDFAPWNVKECDGHIGVIDWEAAEERSFPMMDIFHFFYSIHSLLKKTPVDPSYVLNLAEVQAYVDRIGIGADHASNLWNAALAKKLFRALVSSDEREVARLKTYASLDR